MLTKRDWRFLDTGYHSAAENMALDDVILESRAQGWTPNTIRLLQFDPQAVLVGYNQSVEQEVRTDFCEKRGIEINRRLTGGGAIFFDRQCLGWEIFASRLELGVHQPVTEVFKKMCSGPIRALRMLGIPASFRSKNDVEVEGKKISGTGGTERDDAFLFQGTLLIDYDVDTMIRALRIPVEKLKDKEMQSVKERLTSIKSELKHLPPLQDIKQCLKKGFEEALDVKLMSADLISSEKELLRDRLKTYQSKEWVYLDRRPLDESASVSALEKTPGGLIRVSLALDLNSKCIKMVLITGDFFVFPSRAILDLEAALKYASYEKDELAIIVQDFFRTTNTQIPGVTPHDLIRLLRKATSKVEYASSLGITVAEANHIYTVNGDLMAILKADCGALLLPYCAKLPTCEYRKKEGCVKCGQCSIGLAYELAEEAGLPPLTIHSFEHLLSTLKQLKQQGLRSYLGCCCEGFFSKHHDDFEQTGIPALLINIDDKTCYDLGKEKEALEGTFENKTELRINLLSKLVKQLHHNQLTSGTKKQNV